MYWPDAGFEQIAVLARELSVLIDLIKTPLTPKEKTVVERIRDLTRQMEREAALSVDSGVERRGFGMSLPEWIAVTSGIIYLLSTLNR